MKKAKTDDEVIADIYTDASQAIFKVQRILNRCINAYANKQKEENDDFEELVRKAFVLQECNQKLNDVDSFLYVKLEMDKG